jgi:hypothetical protein
LALDALPSAVASTNFTAFQAEVDKWTDLYNPDADDEDKTVFSLNVARGLLAEAAAIRNNQSYSDPFLTDLRKRGPATRQGKRYTFLRSTNQY